MRSVYRVCFSLLLLAHLAPGLACKYRAIPLKQSAASSDAVFIATAATSSNGMSGKGPNVPAMMRVAEVVKGKVKPGQVIPVHTSNSSCGLGIQAGQVWLILASGEPLGSDQPSGSLLLADTEAKKLVASELGLTLP